MKDDKNRFFNFLVLQAAFETFCGIAAAAAAADAVASNSRYPDLAAFPRFRRFAQTPFVDTRATKCAQKRPAFRAE